MTFPIAILALVVVAMVVVSLLGTRNEGRLVSGPVAYRTFWRRFWASLIDEIIFLPLAFGIDLIAGAEMHGWLALTFDAAYGLIAIAYTVALHGYYGQTFGKMAMRVKVVRNDTEGKIDFRRAFIRESPWAALLIAGCVVTAVSLVTDASAWHVEGASWFLVYASFTWFLVEVLTMLTNKKRRALHDLIAGTVVVKVV